MRGKRDNGGCLVNPNYINYVHNLNFAPKRHCGDGIQLLRSFTQSYSKTTPCFYDCHTFETPAFSLPYKLKDGEFICWGHFCSLECCKAFASEENNPRKDSSISLIALMGVKIWPNLGASSSNEFETLGDSLMTIAPLVIKLEMASIAVSFLRRKSSQS